MIMRAMWLAALAACGGNPPQPAHAVAVVADAAVADAPALDQDLPRLVQRSLALYGDVGRALAASGTDCAQAVTQLGQLVPGYRDVAPANAKVVRDGRTAELRQALAPYGDAFDRAAQAVMQSPAMASCAADARFARALDALFAPPPGS